MVNRKSRITNARQNGGVGKRMRDDKVIYGNGVSKKAKTMKKNTRKGKKRKKKDIHVAD